MRENAGGIKRCAISTLLNHDIMAIYAAARRMEGGRNHNLAGADTTPPKYELVPRVLHIRELPFMTSPLEGGGGGSGNATK